MRNTVSFDHVLKRGTGLIQDAAQVLERLPDLRFEISFTDDLAVGRNRNLPRYEHLRLGAIDPPGLRKAQLVLPAPWVDLPLVHAPLGGVAAPSSAIERSSVESARFTRD